MQKVEFGVVWGTRDHSMSLAMSSFDRGHTTSYSTLIETMCLSCTIFDLQQVILSKVAYFNIPHAHFAPSVGVACSNFAKTFDVRKLESLGYCVVMMML